MWVHGVEGGGGGAGMSQDADHMMPAADPFDPYNGMLFL